MSPYQALLCQRSPEAAREWEAGFNDAARWLTHARAAGLAYANQIHAAVAQGLPGAETARRLDLPYEPRFEGFWHGVYGLLELERIQVTTP